MIRRESDDNRLFGSEGSADKHGKVTIVGGIGASVRDSLADGTFANPRNLWMLSSHELRDVACGHGVGILHLLHR